MKTLLQLDRLSIAFGGPSGERRVVDELSVDLHESEVLALVGESGSGKTMVSRAILGILPPGGAVAGGRILYRGRDLTALPARELRNVRGAGIGLVLQEPLTSLNPALRIGAQMSEALKWHFGVHDDECRRRSVEMLERVGIDHPEGCLGRYPHEFSGGMRQRILIAAVLMLKPPLLIADEPTTALDVLVQQQVLDVMLEIVREQNTAVLLITHDLGLAARHAQRVAVMHRGRLMDSGSLRETLLYPRHEYTGRLLSALPRRDAPAGDRPALEPLCVATDVTVRYHGRRKLPWLPRPGFDAVRRVNLTVFERETLVVVGQSGSGKTTLARAMLGLLPLHAGRIAYRDVDLGTLSSARLRRLRRRLQMVFQDPYSALDPRQTVLMTVAEGLRHVDGLDRAERMRRSLAMLEDVGLDEGVATRFPHELSGGQRQRVNIARALVSEPEFVVADEPVSSLDITVQAEILLLFKRLQERRGFTCLFITHDLGVAEQVADRVAVMYRARIVEQGSCEQIFDEPCHPYTRSLLAAAPMLRRSDDGGYRLVHNAIDTRPAPDGYAFAGDAVARAATAEESLVEVASGHYVACTAAPAEQS